MYGSTPVSASVVIPPVFVRAKIPSTPGAPTSRPCHATRPLLLSAGEKPRNVHKPELVSAIGVNLYEPKNGGGNASLRSARPAPATATAASASPFNPEGGNFIGVCSQFRCRFRTLPRTIGLRGKQSDRKRG